METGHDFFAFAGKCKEMSEALVANDASLRLVRGYYECPIWGRREHWWAQRDDGSVIDPTVRQFPTCGVGAEYVEFDGTVTCEQCGTESSEEDAVTHGNYAFCSDRCLLRCVGL